MFSCEFCGISRNTFYYRTHLVPAPEVRGVGAKGNIVRKWFVAKDYLEIFHPEKIQL